MDLFAIVGVFVLSSTLAVAAAGGVVGLLFYTMGVPVVARQRTSSRTQR